jgi:hypothetical protein
LAFAHIALLSQTILTDAQAKEFAIRWHAQHRTRYLVRARTAGADQPQVKSLRPLLDTLQKRGFVQVKRTNNTPEAPSLLSMRLTGKPSAGLAIRLFANTAKAEDKFLYNIFSIALAATPGTPDGRLLGDNSAYWPSRLLYYVKNVSVSLSCDALPTECPDHARFVEQALRNGALSQ